MGDLFFFIGTVGGISLLAYVVYIMVRAYFIPKGNMIFSGFVLVPELKKLDKSKFKIIKRLHPDTADKRNFIDIVLVSNYGVFFIKKKDIKGVVEKAQGRDCNKVTHKGHIRFYKDDTAELIKDIEKIKREVMILKDIKTHAMTVYPNETEVKVESQGFCGNFKDMAGFIDACCLKENEISDELKEEVYKALTNEKETVEI